MTRLGGRRALVTGASSGIGAATARSLARAGARVILVARSSHRLEQVAASIRQEGGQATVFAVDLADPQAVAAMATRVRAEPGSPDVIVNNAGAGSWRYVEETSAAEAVAMMAAPYFAAFFVTREFLPLMLERDEGHVVNVSSIASRLVWPGATGYTAARWAMRGFSEALRADLTGTGVRVTHASFAKVASEYFEHNPGSAERVPAAQRMIREIAPEEAARAIVRGVLRDRYQVVEPFSLRLVLLQASLFPWAARRQMTTSPPRRSPRVPAPARSAP